MGINGGKLKATNSWVELLKGISDPLLPSQNDLKQIREDKLTENGLNSKLIRLITVSRHAHRNLADPSILNVTDELLDLLKAKEICIPERNIHRVVFGRISIIEHICRVFDPLLSGIIPIGTLAWTELAKGSTPLPLSDHLHSKDNLYRFASNLKSAAQVLEEWFHPEVVSDGGWETMKRRGESLSLVAEIFDAIREVIQEVPPMWCGICFRRALVGIDYCGLHSTSKLLKNDTRYRNEKPIRASLSDDVIQQWERYKRTRIYFGESVELVSNPNELDASISVNAKIIIVSPELKKLVDQTLFLHWNKVRDEWESLFEVEFRYASVLLVRRPSEFGEWSLFAGYMLDVFKDTGESTSHPFWILYIIVCADQWLKALHENSDKMEFTDNQLKIKKIFKSGITNASEIAAKLGLTREYVSSIIKKYGLRKDISTK